DILMCTYLSSWNAFAEELILNNFARQFEHPDDLTFIFTLRPDVKAWPVGPAADETLTATDCVERFQTRGPALSAPEKRCAKRIAHFQTPGLQTFKFVMSEPFVPSVRE